MTDEIQFWDHSKRRDWFMVRAVTRKVLARPEILAEIRECVERVWVNDPFNLRSLRLWRKVLVLTPEEFARAVLADTSEALDLRESYPPYFMLTQPERLQYIAAARKELAIP